MDIWSLSSVQVVAFSCIWFFSVAMCPSSTCTANCLKNSNGDVLPRGWINCFGFERGNGVLFFRNGHIGSCSPRSYFECLRIIRWLLCSWFLIIIWFLINYSAIVDKFIYFLDCMKVSIATFEGIEQIFSPFSRALRASSLFQVWAKVAFFCVSPMDPSPPVSSLQSGMFSCISNLLLVFYYRFLFYCSIVT